MKFGIYSNETTTATLVAQMMLMLDANKGIEGKFNLNEVVNDLTINDYTDYRIIRYDDFNEASNGLTSLVICDNPSQLEDINQKGAITISVGEQTPLESDYTISRFANNEDLLKIVEIIKCRIDERHLKEEREKKEKVDFNFLLSAITAELLPIVKRKYFFNTLEANGGYQWFYDECVIITEQVMFSKDSMYIKWLNHIDKVGFKNTCFGTFIEKVKPEAEYHCFDWYFMQKAKALFQKKYEEDSYENIVSQAKDETINVFKNLQSKKDRERVFENVEKHFKEKKQKEITKKVTEIQSLLEGLDAETIEQIKKQL